MKIRTPFKGSAQPQEDRALKGTLGFCPVTRPLKPCLRAAQPPPAAISTQTSWAGVMGQGVGGRTTEKLKKGPCSATKSPPSSLGLTKFIRPSVDLGLSPQPPPLLDPSPPSVAAEDKGEMMGLEVRGGSCLTCYQDYSPSYSCWWGSQAHRTQLPTHFSINRAGLTVAM